MRRIIATAIVSALAGTLVTGALMVEPESSTADPYAVCSEQEDSVLYDCETGEPLDYMNGVWVTK